MNVQFNHTFVWCRDKQKSATFLTGILGLPGPIPFGSDGHMLVVRVDNGCSLDFCEKEGEIARQHYAFLVGEEDFDQIVARLLTRGVQYWANPHKGKPGEFYRHNGGRGAYFEDPNGHILEVMTRPYDPSKPFENM